MPLTPKQDREFDVIHEGEENILFIYVETLPITPSIEDSDHIMEKTIDILNQVSGITKLVFTQKRDYEYGYEQTQILLEIAKSDQT